jgi:hypothetical protein
MKRVLLVLLVLFAFNSNAQIITSPDTAVCGSYVDTLQALSAVQSSMFSDDQHDVLLDIGFTFNFYGLPYTQLVVSGNGYVTFDASQASSYSPWAINAAIPNKLAEDPEFDITQYCEPINFANSFSKISTSLPIV